ncbi:hypothetical protein AcW1_000438 [Taiwanofungus camphoratus]|nr:hypothetical protein AcV5_004337 [Antrodia cinnamomea]KAI0961326.1 hypothetical protein AcV7_000459 [Antrodia cinnamomea]KAI0963332.1 hypothetical protein AcW1_000438 [Antrodia cinnamomea]
MLFDLETANDLKPWLVRNLEPICDAEPGALAEYILALLKHNAPENDLRKELASQLDEFLEKEGPPFIDTLFTVLRTKSYLPYSATSPSSGYPSSSTQQIDTGIPIPLDALLSPSIPTSPERGRKRSIDHDDRDSRPPAKGPRLNNDGQFSRYGRNDNRSSWGSRSDRGGRMGMNGRGDYMDGAMNGGMEMSSGMNGAMGSMGPMNGRGTQTYRPPDRRGICRDYYNNGYCARGAFCKYSHGEDAVIPAQLFPMNSPMGVGPMPFVPMLPNGGMPFGITSGSNAAYDPHERMDMRPTQSTGQGVNNRPSNPRAPIIPRQGDSNGSVAQKPGELPVIQDLTPKVSKEEGSIRAPTQDEFSGPSRQDVIGMNAGNNMMYGSGAMTSHEDVEMAGASTAPSRSGPRNGRGGGRGTFGGDVHSFRPEKRNDKTLVVEKIPEDKLSLGAVNEWFKRFGTVTNVAVDAVNAKALVSFSNHDEALAAWRSEDAVFGNRFVKVFWHRPMDGHGQVGARMLAASAPLMANMAAKEASPSASTAPAETLVTPSTVPISTSARKPSIPSAAAALAAKQRLLEQQIAEQKSLMALLSTASPQERKDIMARLRKLGEEMTSSASASQSPPPAATPSAAPVARKPSRGITPRSEDQERLERERLDKELELHHAVNAVEGEAEESTEDLKAKLEKLKAEAASLGLPEGSETMAYGSTSFRPYRGRARGGRGFYRGAMRGGPPRASMKLDLRPKRLLVKGANGDAVQAVRDWYETTGQVESIDAMDEGVIVTFRTRAAAEQGLAKGMNIPTVGQVQLSWHASQQPGVAPVQKTTPRPAESSLSVDKGIPAHRLGSPAELEEAPLQEEQSVGGWGGDDGEDGFGML